MELETSLHPRTIPFITGDNKSNLDGLRPYVGTQVFIEYTPCCEPEQAVGAIKAAVENPIAGWKVVSITPKAGLFDGVMIRAAHNPTLPNDAPPYSSLEAGEALKSLLLANRWNLGTISFVLKESDLPPNTLKVQVGLKPEPYFEEPEQKEIGRLTQEFFKAIDKPGIPTAEIEQKQHELHDKISQLMKKMQDRLTPKP